MSDNEVAPAHDTPRTTADESVEEHPVTAIPSQPPSPAVAPSPPTLPRMKAEVWALAKCVPFWELAAARLVHLWSPSELLAESDFDKGVERVRSMTFG